MRSRSRSWLFVCAVACGPRALEGAAPVPTDEIGGSSSGTSSAVDVVTGATVASDTTTRASASSSSETETTESESESTATPASETETSDVGGEACAPPDQPGGFSASVSGVGMFPADVTWTCTIETLVAVSESVTMSLACPDHEDPFEIEFTANPPPSLPLAEGDVVDLRFVEYNFLWIWVETFLRLDKPGFGHVLTLIDASFFDPFGEPEFPRPVEIWTVPGICPIRPGDCADREPLGLEFRGKDGSDVVFDEWHANLSVLDHTEVWVDDAEKLWAYDCADVPEAWFRVLIAARN